MIKYITVTNTDGTTETIPVGQLAAEIAALISITDSSNLQITSSKSVNIEPTKHLKVKPGDGAQIELLPDHTGDLSEVLVKVQTSVDETGADLESEIPVRLKINSTELELNTKGATDINPYDVKFKTGVKESKSGEHYCQTKLKGRSFDIRCYEHGGIALQPCGQDSDSNENKIKFESDRTSLPTADATYQGEGGMGLEFGTFNNLHSSLFTKDYRFNKDGMVYAVTRGALETDADSGKVDYPTQSDDFKDIVDTSLGVTWEDIIKATLYLKNNGSI